MHNGNSVASKNVHVNYVHTLEKHSPSLVLWHNEQILNGTSAQLGCTVPLMVYTGKYRPEDDKETKHTQKSKQHKKQQNKTTLV